MAGDAIMKPVRVMFIASALAALGGCIAVPVSPGYYAGPQDYSAPPPAYYGAPGYYGPSFGFGIYGGRHGYGRGYWHR